MAATETETESAAAAGTEREQRTENGEQKSRWHKLRAYRMQIVMNYCVLL